MKRQATRSIQRNLSPGDPSAQEDTKDGLLCRLYYLAGWDFKGVVNITMEPPGQWVKWALLFKVLCRGDPSPSPTKPRKASCLHRVGTFTSVKGHMSVFVQGMSWNDLESNHPIDLASYPGTCCHSLPIASKFNVPVDSLGC